MVQLDAKYIFGTLTSPSAGVVELQVPHFWDRLVFDPNFSLLVTDLGTDAQGCFEKEGFGLSNTAITLIVIFGTVGVAAFIIGVSFILLANIAYFSLM